MKLSKKELAKLEQQMAVQPARKATWCGFRPVTMDNRKYNKKAVRREGRRACQEY